MKNAATAIILVTFLSLLLFLVGVLNDWLYNPLCYRIAVENEYEYLGYTWSHRKPDYCNFKTYDQDGVSMWLDIQTANINWDFRDYAVAVLRWIIILGVAGMAVLLTKKVGHLT